MTVRPGRINLLRAAESALWAIVPAKYDEVREFLALRASGHTLSKRELAARGFSTAAARPGTLESSSGGRVAVLPLHGVVAHHAGFEMQISGGTSTVAFGQAFDAALNDPNVTAIVIDCDSPGGTVEGVAELADKILKARGVKPIKAVANAGMHSAAYWICCGADEVYVTPSGSVGNIGVMTVRLDTSEMEAKEGIKRTMLKAGKFKGEGAPFEPMSEEEKSATLARVEEVYAQFVGHVAKARGTSAKAVRDGYGEGRSLGAKKALEAGLVDGVATMESVLAEFGAQAPKKSVARAGMAALAALNAETCPECGHEMEDGTDVCPECDDGDTEEALSPAALAAASTLLPELASAVTAATTPSTLEASAGSAAAPSAREPITQPTTTPESHTMTEQEKQEALAALRAAETERVNSIRALCADHGMSLKADEFISKGLTVDAVRAAILDEKKTITEKTRVPVVSSVVQRSDKDPKKGFANHREFLTAVIENRARDLSQVKDERLKALAVRDGDEEYGGGELAFMLPTGIKAAAGSDEQGNYSNSVGGFAGNLTTRLPGMLSVGFEGDPLAGRTQDVPMATPTVEILARTDKNHTTSVSGGFTVARKAETAAATASRMSMEKVSLRATSLFGAAYATEELLVDSPMSFAAIIDAGFRDQFGAAILNEKIRGLGDGEYLGVLNADCTVSQAKETNQTAATIVTQNILKMRARCWGYQNAVWIANQDTIPQLGQLSVGLGTGGALMWSTSAREDLPDMLYGRPIFYSEFCATLGTVGDIMLLNMSQYLEGTYQPLQSAESIHVRFLNHERTFKFWTRNAGQPWWRSALTPNKSSVTLSPFVTLATRA